MQCGSAVLTFLQLYGKAWIMAINTLSDRFVVSLKPEAKERKYFDGGGLYIAVKPNGKKFWRMSYRINGVARTLSIGEYPVVMLKDAREKRTEAKRLLESGVDPSKQKKVAHEAVNTQNSLRAVSEEWFEKFKGGWKPDHAKDTWARLEKNVLDYVGNRPIGDIKPLELLEVLRKIEARGALEQAHRVMQICGAVYRYAVATGKAEGDITRDLRGAIPPKKTKHFPTITDPEKVGALMRAIDGYDGSFVVASALRMAPRVFVRPGELRWAVWSEFNLEKAEWRIPADRMKMDEQHIVPLSAQVCTILENLQAVTGDGKFLFPGLRKKEQPISDAAVNAALRRLGYEQEELTGHGFRSMASTLLNELGWNRDAIERQLAHAERNSIRAAYNFAEFLPERRRMMQAWADYLEELKTNGDRIALVHERYGPQQAS